LIALQRASKKDDCFRVVATFECGQPRLAVCNSICQCGSHQCSQHYGYQSERRFSHQILATDFAAAGHEQRHQLRFVLLNGPDCARSLVSAYLELTPPVVVFSTLQ
jgi:hypothetical protein